MNKQQLNALINYIDERARYEAERQQDPDRASLRDAYEAEQTLRAAFNGNEP